MFFLNTLSIVHNIDIDYDSVDSGQILGKSIALACPHQTLFPCMLHAEELFSMRHRNAKSN